MSDDWARFALEQAQIIVHHLEGGNRNEEFLLSHSLQLIQIVAQSDQAWAPVKR